jgi:diadenosine tetraphosphatase ApaH/serine/threonine PP2A family protein phosphatase
MKVATLYDIHGNLLALQATLAEIEQIHPDLMLVGGDIVSGPMPRAVLERLWEFGERVRFICGNADREVVVAFDGLPLDPGLSEEVREVTMWTARQLTQRHRDFLASLPEQAIIDVDGLGDVLFCHGSPRSDEEIVTAITPEARLREILAGVKQPVVVCGHTHVQFDLHADNVRIVNSGSVGMPYGEPGAYWLLLGPGIEFQHTLYDLEAAAAVIRASGYPLADDFADNNVIKPATAAEATEFFEHLAAQRAS